MQITSYYHENLFNNIDINSIDISLELT
jgi:hypothetical protein